jgi:WD40 repeat protein
MIRGDPLMATMRASLVLLALVFAACARVSPAVPPPSDAPVRTLHGHHNTVTSLAVSADGRLLVSASRDGSVRLWRVDSGTPQAVLTPERWLSSTWVVAMSPDGRRVAAAGDDFRIRAWSLPDATLLATLPAHTNSIRALAFSPDGRLLASGSRDDSVLMWNTAAWTFERRLVHGNTVRALTFSADGSRLFAGTADDVIDVWAIPSGTRVTELHGHTNAVQALALRDGRLVSGSADRTVRLWATTTLEPIGRLTLDREHEPPDRLERYGIIPGPEVLALALTADGQRLASAHRGSAMRVWDLKTQRLEQEIRSPAPTTYALAFRPDGRRLFSGGDDATIYEWEVR